MRILLFPKEFPSVATPGAGIFILRRAQALQALGHDVGVVRIVPHAPPWGVKWARYRAIPQNEIFEGVPVRTIRAVFPPRMLLMEYLDAQVHRALAREIAHFAPDIVNASFLIPNGQLAVRQRAAVVVTAHGSDAYAWPQRRKGLMQAAREAIARAPAVTAVSSFIAARVRAICDRDVDVIWNGADERFFFPRDRAPARERLNLPHDRPVIAFAGNLLRAKGLFELLDASARLAAQQPVIVLAGTGSDEDALRAHARELGVDCRFAGRLPSADIGHLFSAADIVTLPSYGEGLPNVVCEAMLNGNAVVATDVGGIPEIVQENETGLLVKPRDAGALAHALQNVIERPALRDAFEKNARAFALEHLTWRISAQQYERVYRRVLDAS